MRVLCLVPYPTLGASNRLRVEQYVPLLREVGIQMDVSPYFDLSTYLVLYKTGHTLAKARGVLRGLLRRVRDLARVDRYDLVLIHREAMPIGPPLVERGLSGRGIRYVFDFDDAIFLPAVHPVNRQWAWLRSPSRVAETASRAAALIVGNEYLATHARRWNPNVTVIPTPVDTDRHRPRSSSAARDEGPLVVGWVGSSTTAPYLHILDEPLARLGRRLRIVLCVIGGEFSHASVPVERRPYSLEREPEDIARFDIGVLPEPDDAWTRGKGAFKALLYMAAAVPVVASRVGVNSEVVVDGVTGYCVDDADSWVVAVERLGADETLRERLGAAGRERVERHYSLRVQAPRLAEALRAVAAGSTS